jgi:hypothetical protein
MARITNVTGIPPGWRNPTHLLGRFVNRPNDEPPYVPLGITMGLTFDGSLPLAWSASSVSGRP